MVLVANFVGDGYKGKCFHCYTPNAVHLLWKNNEIVFLSRMGGGTFDETSSLNWINQQIKSISNPNFEIIYDEKYVIENLSYPQLINLPNHNVTLKLNRVVLGEQNESLIDPIATDSVVGQIYTTKISKSVSDFFIDDERNKYCLNC